MCRVSPTTALCPASTIELAEIEAVPLALPLSAADVIRIESREYSTTAFVFLSR